MNKRQKIVQGRFLDNEEAVISELEKTYAQALKDVEAKAAKLHKEFEELTKALDDVEDEAEREVLKSRIRSKVYQKKYQEGLKKQINDILDNMHEAGYKTVSEYLDKCYEDGFCGALYDLQGQGIPLAFPIDQEAVTRAVQLDSKISQGLYAHLGEDTAILKKHITAQVSRGIATGMSYSQIARNLSGKMTGNYNKPGGSLAYAQRIARTEGHRIQCQAAMDCCYKAREKGADVVKRWDSTLDGRTRVSHIKVDGEIKELDEPFSNGLMFPSDPNGKAAEVINCRCALFEDARWAFGGGFTKMNNFTKELEEFESPEDYNEFKKAFFSKENRQYMNYVTELENRYETKNFEKLLGKMTDREYKHFTDLQNKSPWFNKNVLTNTVKSDKISFESMKFTGIDADYIPDIEGAFSGLMDDYPIAKLHVKTNRAEREFGHFQGGIKGTKKQGEQYAVLENEICISKASYKNRATSTDEHIYNYKSRESALQNVKRCDLATIPHEYGHAIDHAYVLAKETKLREFAERYRTPQKVVSIKDVNAINDFNMAVNKSNSRLSKEIFDELQKEYNLDYMGTVMRIDAEYGHYASSSISEFLAEAFANMRMLPDAEKTDFMKSFEKIFNRKFNEVLRE